MLKKILELCKGTKVVTPIATDMKKIKTDAMLDCNCVDGNCTNCD